MGVLLGLDLGTTNCKALALNEQGQPIAVASIPTPVQSTLGVGEPHGNSRSEFDAVDLWDTSVRLVRDVLARLAPGQPLLGLAVASMAESVVLVDDQNRPLAPVIPWHDTRTMPWVGWWRQRISGSELYRVTGLNLGHIYSAPKLQWYQDQWPDLMNRVACFLSIGDWIGLCLTGRRAMSHSQACRTMLFDVHTRDWSRELVRLARLPKDVLPPLVVSGQIVGAVTEEAALATGLPAGLPVVMGGHDHGCAALGAGVITPGSVLDSSGTVEALLLTTDTALTEDRDPISSPTCGCHTVKDRYYLLGGMMSGSVMDWMVRLFGGDNLAPTRDEMMAEAAAAPLGAHGVWFQPYLSGSGPPHRNPQAWGAWLGLRLGHSRGDLLRAGVEGLTFGIKSMLDGLQAHSGLRISEVRAVGGGTRNPWWQQVKADIFGIPVQTVLLSDVAAQGAALLAGIGVGVFRDAEHAAAVAYRPGVRYTVDRDRHDLYQAAYEQTFKTIYPALLGISL